MNELNESRVKELEDELAALRAGAAMGAQGASPRVVLETATGQVASVFGADFLEILSVGHTDRIDVFATWSTRDAGLIDLDHSLLADDQLAREIVRTKKPARHDSISRPTRADVPSAARPFPITSSVGVPIVLDGNVWGALLVHSTGDVPFAANTEERLSHFDAAMTAVVINSLRTAAVEQLFAEQAALLRIAELVARESAADGLFRAVAEQLGLLTRVSGAQVFRFDNDDMATSVGGWGPIDSGIKLGSQVSTLGNSAAGQVRSTGLPARVEDYSAVEGEIGALQRGVGMQCAVAAPIRVAGRLWGALIVGSVKNDVLPPETEERMARFADLVGVALANLEARAELQGLAEVQESLRRVATVVAREEWDLTLPTIVREIGFLHRANASGSVIIRYENEEFATVLAGWGEPNLNQFEGQLLPFGGENPGAYVWATSRPARQQGFEGAAGQFAELSRQLGITETVASPVFVGNRLWGAIVVITTSEISLPHETEERLGQFAELIGTSIGNMNSRLDLIESRARIVQTADETRRRFERDLHDGIQQRLVGISMELRDLETTLPVSADRQRERVSNIADQLVGALDDLRELSRGLHPAILSEGGLGPALRSLARRSPIPVKLAMAELPRLADSIEVAAYYVVSEALTNASKYSQASKVEITIELTADGLRVTIADDGIGDADPSKGSGLLGLTDRVDALGGVFSVSSPPGKGTRLAATFPLEITSSL